MYDLCESFEELQMLDGIYHSGIVVHDREYYLTQMGICSAVPGQTPYGRPTKIFELGKTEITHKDFNDFLSIQRKEAKDFDSDQCNSFSIKCAAFLKVETAMLGESLKLPDFMEEMNESVLNGMQPLIG